MGFVSEQRESDSPLIETIMRGHTEGSGIIIRPAESHWHMVLLRFEHTTRMIITGPLTTSGQVAFGEGANLLWIKFKLGTFMPHMPMRRLVDRETALPQAVGPSFRLYDSAWEFPTFDTVETFAARLVRQNVLAHDPLISAALRGQQPDLSPRTVRHRFLQATGQTQKHIRQFQRAQQAALFLAQGQSIADVMFELGYYDQPHLTRSLKRFVGTTPAQQITDAGH